MRIFYSVDRFKKYRAELADNSYPIGLVPTMGALHEGHISLVRQAGVCKTIFVSIFVNPTQFNDPSDLKNYPVNIEKDLALLEKENVHAVLIPPVSEIYPKPDTRKFNFGYLEKVMEGKHRPNHFNGVAQVVSRLFDIFQPDKAFFGQKDFQQLAIINLLVKQLQYDIEIVPCPIVRESDGLAMSSRNELLNKNERKSASLINKILFQAKEQKSSMGVKELEKFAMNQLAKIDMVSPEYFEIIDYQSLEPVKSWKHPGKIIACLAVKINKVRLIDNLIFN